MPQSKTPKREPTVLSPQDLSNLSNARSRARAKGKEITVSAYTRVHYSLSSSAMRRLASFQTAELAILRLCSHRDRSGPKAGDREHARALVSLLTDTFSL